MRRRPASSSLLLNPPRSFPPHSSPLLPTTPLSFPPLTATLDRLSPLPSIFSCLAPQVLRRGPRPQNQTLLSPSPTPLKDSFDFGLRFESGASDENDVSVGVGGAPLLVARPGSVVGGGGYRLAGLEDLVFEARLF